MYIITWKLLNKPWYQNIPEDLEISYWWEKDIFTLQTQKKHQFLLYVQNNIHTINWKNLAIFYVLNKMILIINMNLTSDQFKSREQKFSLSSSYASFCKWTMMQGINTGRYMCVYMRAHTHIYIYILYVIAIEGIDIC